MKIVSCVNFTDKKRKKQEEQILEELINYLFWKVLLYKGVQECNKNFRDTKCRISEDLSNFSEDI